MKLTWEFPLETTSEANSREHWHKKAVRHTKQKDIVKLCLRSKIKQITLPCHIKLTRIAPRSLDAHDNLPMSMKFILDATCELLLPNLPAGKADADPRLSFSYAQEKGKILKVRIEIESLQSL